MTVVVAVAAVAVVLSLGVGVAPALARAPNFMDSAGYQARLAESRAALASPQRPVRYYKRKKVKTLRPVSVTPKVGQ
jgi:hypothetical protein